MDLFISQHPDLISEYDFVKNSENGIDLNTISSGSSKHNSGCPYCNGKKVLKGYNDLETKFPEISIEWDYERNNGLLPSEVTPFSDKKVYWRCPLQHSYIARVATRTKAKNGCPYCTGKKVLKGYNDLETRFPEIAMEWDYEKNGRLLPSEVSPFSSKKAYWICPSKHSYSSCIANRTSQNQGCPYCAGRRVLRGFNDLESQHPELVKEWNYEKNAPLLPSEITCGSSRKAWWICSTCSFEWEAVISTRTGTRKQGCPRCGMKKGIEKRNRSNILNGMSVAEKTPWLLSQWDYEKNSVSPYEISYQSNRRCYWLCDKGHSYDLRTADKANGQGCPYCAGKRVLKGFNDLESHNPEVLTDWDYESNTIKPDEITFGSGRKVYWKCQNCGAPYLMSLGEKRRKGSKFCPLCRREIGSSIPEQIVYFYTKIAFPDAINSYRNAELLNKWELDVYIPSVKVAIEYDGRAWHGDRKRDEEKSNILASNGIKLIRLRETDAPEINDKSIKIVVHRSKNEDGYIFMQKPLDELFEYLHGTFGSEKPPISLEKDISEITAGFLRLQKENSLAKCFPEIAKQLHPTKNGDLKPETIGARSGQVVWWQCPKCGHEWKSRIIDRTTKGQGCYVCGLNNGVKKRRFALLEKNGSFVDLNPELLNEWDYDKNEGLLPEHYTNSSSQKVWWRCASCGTTWQARIADRTTKGQGCPKCGYGKAQQSRIQKKILQEGSLADNFPNIAAEWDFENNPTILPTQVTFASNKNVWWKCKTCGKSWQARVSQRTRGQGCPYCYRSGIIENQIPINLDG